METGCEVNVEVSECPDASVEIEAKIRRTVDELIRFVNQDTEQLKLIDFEESLWSRVRILFRLCVALFLAVRHQRLDVSKYTGNGWRVKEEFAQRTIKTMCGPVRYGRAYLTRRNGGGWFPLDAMLGITQDGFSLRVVDVVTRLATRLSYSATRGVMKAILGWSPSTEAIELLVIGVGRRAPAFMDTQGEFEDDGEVLVIEVDGKAAPMATEAELEARRQKRKHAPSCSCGCQRHRGRRRRRGKKKKRKKRGHNSKNGRSATLVAMYTLRHSEDGKLHGPIHKKIWGQFGKRQEAMQWAREQATRRGFGPDTSKVIQIVVDGERCLRKQLQELFPGATFTLDLRHAQERLWKAGRLFHEEDSAELEAWVKPLNDLLLAGQVDRLLKRLRKIQSSVARRGPNTKKKREGLQKHIEFYESRREMMQYDKYHRDDLVLATGVIEGACRYVIGERLDCSGMRWTLAGAEPLLQLRCIELNGDWSRFITWVSEETTAELQHGTLVRLRSPKPKSHSRNTTKRDA
jgi:hypothetical protein